MDWSYAHKVWEKWASSNLGTSGEDVIKAALLVNYDPAGPSRLLSTIAEQAGMKTNPIEINQFVNFVKRNNMQNETFCIGPNEYLVTSIHEHWFHARCMNTPSPAGEGAIVMQTSSFLVVALYDGSIGSASSAIAAVDKLAHVLSRRNL